MSHPLLALDGISVAYAKVEAVRGVSLAMAPGSIVTVIGANGAGKTTLLNAVMGLLPSRGGIAFDGVTLDGLAIEERVVMGLALVPERRELFGSMSVEDNLVLGGFRTSAAERAQSLTQVFARFPRLIERRKQLAGTLSGGERQMLAMGRALMGRPRLLMLDEPSLGLAPLIVRDIFEIIVGLRKTGVSILLVSRTRGAAGGRPRLRHGTRRDHGRGPAAHRHRPAHRQATWGSAGGVGRGPCNRPSVVASAGGASLRAWRLLSAPKGQYVYFRRWAASWTMERSACLLTSTLPFTKPRSAVVSRFLCSAARLGSMLRSR